jgi:HAD superfamily hydrolase (TIGR01549 family)
MKTSKSTPTAILFGFEYVATIRAICFDAFGTVVEITDKRRPFQKLLHNDYDDVSVRAMTQPIGLRALASQLQPGPQDEMVDKLEEDLAAECASIVVRQGMKSVWEALKRAQLKIAICSNLAVPYAVPMIRALPDTPDGLVLSYRVGLMKPHKDIYSIVASQLDLKISQILFVGDRLEEDVVAPVSAGASSMPIGEFETSFRSAPSIFAPANIRELFERISAAKGG